MPHWPLLPGDVLTLAPLPLCVFARTLGSNRSATQPHTLLVISLQVLSAAPPFANHIHSHYFLLPIPKIPYGYNVMSRCFLEKGREDLYVLIRGHLADFEFFTSSSFSNEASSLPVKLRAIFIPIMRPHFTQV